MPRLDIDAIRRRHSLASIVGADVKLKRRGGELIGCCPFHADRSPSFAIYNGGARWICFGCGAQGDLLDYLQRAHSVGLRDAAAMLEGGNLPVIAVNAPPPDDKPARLEKARAIWRNASPAAETPAGVYLRARGLHLPIPDSIRFARLPYGREAALHPCLVSLVASADHKLSGIQRTYLTDDGRKAFGRESKRSLGRVAGGAIRCAPAGVDGLILTEGLEDALTLQQEIGRAAWAAAGAGMLSKMQIPFGIRSIVVGADGDDVGEAAAQKAADAFAARGLSVRIIRPIEGCKDFNDELTGDRS